MNSGLAGKVVMVTGAGGGIGSAIARAFIAEGASVVLHYRSSAAKCKAIGLQAKKAGVGAVCVQADLTREGDVRRLISTAVKTFGRLDTLVANAASWETKDVPLHEMSLRQWRSTLDGLLTSAFLTTREFLRVVAKQGQGNVVLISSTAGVFGEAGHADYASAKSALAYGFPRSLKNELSRLAPHTKDYCGGRINSICPGWTVVPRLAAKLGDKKAIRKVTATMALPQLGRPEDVANAAVFLASDRLARHVTGQNIVLAGGMEGRWLWQPDEVNTEIA